VSGLGLANLNAALLPTLWSRRSQSLCPRGPVLLEFIEYAVSVAAVLRPGLRAAVIVAVASRSVTPRVELHGTAFP